jgi:hypothetical protein
MGRCLICGEHFDFRENPHKEWCEDCVASYVQCELCGKIIKRESKDFFTNDGDVYCCECWHSIVYNTAHREKTKISAKQRKIINNMIKNIEREFSRL